MVTAAENRRWDVVGGVAAAAFLVTVTPLAGDPNTLSPSSYPLAVMAGLSFVVRRRSPQLTVSVTAAVVAAFVMINEDGGPIFVSTLVALAWLGAVRPVTRGWLPWALGATTVVTAATLIGVGPATHVPLLALLLIAAPRIAADGARARALQAAARDEESRRRLVEERLRIVREVHDVVGHGLAAISLRAGVAGHLMAKDPHEAQDALRAIRAVANDSLEDLGALLGVLRDGGPRAERAPVPDIEQVPRLVSRMRDAGLPVDLEVGGGSQPVPEIVGAAVYRIVQEALTNVARHAGAGARARVRLVHDRRSVAVEVLDDGRGGPAALSERGGLTGMRERAAALGGTFEAGTRPAGGFRVAATFPAR